MNVASVKARLKNFASESGRTFQDALTGSVEIIILLPRCADSRHVYGRRRYA